VPLSNCVLWKGQRVENVREIIEIGLALVDEKEKAEFVGKVSELGRVALDNIGYCSGYYNIDTAKKILKLFKTHHPIFGKEWPDKPIMPEEAFRLGMELGKTLNNNN
jgi:hypothetical protein